MSEFSGCIKHLTPNTSLATGSQEKEWASDRKLVRARWQSVDDPAVKAEPIPFAADPRNSFLAALTLPERTHAANYAQLFGARSFGDLGQKPEARPLRCAIASLQHVA